MTEQEKQMERVVKLMPGVFEVKDGQGSSYKFSDRTSSRFHYRSTLDSRSLYLAPTQHAAWVEKCLMEWLEGKGYFVEKGRFVNYAPRGGAWRIYKKEYVFTYSSLWPCLYAAWKHWQEQQKPKPCSKCGQIDVGQQGEYPCSECDLPTEWDKEYPGGNRPKEKTLREGLDEMLRRKDYVLSRELLIDRIMPLVAQHIEGKRGAVEEITCHLEFTCGDKETDITDAIMAVLLGEEKSDEE